MTNIDDISIWLRGENIKEVARETGLHFNTLYRLRDGKAVNLTLATYNIIEQYYQSKSSI
jgi:DNA-binding Xre family transcriptional regulator